MTVISPVSLHDIEDLARLRDELRLQAHLFGAELRVRWNEAEMRWQHLQNEARCVGRTMKNPRVALGVVASLTASALKETYESLRRALGLR